MKSGHRSGSSTLRLRLRHCTPLLISLGLLSVSGSGAHPLMHSGRTHGSYLPEKLWARGICLLLVEIVTALCNMVILSDIKNCPDIRQQFIAFPPSKQTQHTTRSGVEASSILHFLHTLKYLLINHNMFFN